MTKSLFALVLALSSAVQLSAMFQEEITVHLTKRPSNETHEFFSPIPVVIIDNEKPIIQSENGNEHTALVLPEAELDSENGLIQVYFTGGKASNEQFVLVSDFKSQSPRFYIDHNQNLNFGDDGNPIFLDDQGALNIYLKNHSNKAGIYLSKLQRMEIVNEQARNNWKNNIKRKPKFTNIVLSEPDFWFRELRFNILSADVEIDDLRFQIGLMDWNVNGLYNDDVDRILVGKFGAQIMTTDLNDNNYLVGDKSPFAVGNKGFEMISMDDAGTIISFRPIDFGSVIAKIKAGDVFPDVKITSLSGEIESLKDLLKPGKYNYIEFWGVWCKGCIEELPKIKEASELYKDDLQVIGLHFGKISEEKLRKFIETNGVTWLQKLATEETVRAMKVSSYPYGVLVNPMGKIEAFNVRIEEVIRIIKK